MWFTEAVVSALLFGLAGWWMKVSQMRGGHTAFMLLGLYISGTIGFGIHATVEGTLLDALGDPRVWIAGVWIGIGSAMGNAWFMKALDYGPASLTSPLTNMNIVLVIMLGTFVYGEPFSSMEVTGVLLLLCAIVLVSVRTNEKLSIRSIRWYGYVAASILLFAVRNGGLKVTEELGLSNAAVLFVAYAISIAWFGVLAAREWTAIQSVGPLRPSLPAVAARTTRTPARTGLRLGLAAGVFSYGGLQLYALSLQDGQANIAAPIFAANGLVVAIGSIILFKERLSKLQTAAFLLLFVGLICLRL
ncbi:drug/metabolite transporter (DMT)-like permease [Paenibacillus phyllosphaerae]|uniref:Drug/metabolite transporter (DMT)-like permease n=1 Tax=Paenibacillus phyllosphaerae TaxID=274593 RepID=A0A7W5FKT2_9BACL|nr:DMT family transporter [Paenibacillus phyllosphaerae]MBB3108388.1 drug/metabolite transporter (DMT)-like permease [Paenibacillus phyllosphaerae]